MIEDVVIQYLKQNISSWGSFAIALNGVIGSGIFLLPALAAQTAGHLSPWLFPLCGLLILPVVLSIAKVAGHFQHTGGTAAYAGKAFGPFWGTQVGWLAFLAGAGGLSAATNIFVLSAAKLEPSLGQGLPRAGLIVLIWGLLALLNIFGVRQGIRTVMSLTLLKLLPLILLAFYGLTLKVNSLGLLFNFDDSEPLAFGAGLTTVIFAFIGFEGALVPAGETQDAPKNIPRAIIGSLLFSSVLYFLVQATCVLNDPSLQDSKTPLAEVAAIFVGPMGIWLMSLTAMTSILGTLSAGILSHPRYCYSIAMNGNFPAFLGTVHSKFGTPWVSILFSSGLIVTLAISGSFVALAAMTVLAKILLYAISIATLPRFAGKRALIGFPIFGFMSCAFLISQASPESWTAVGFAFLSGALIQVVTKSFKVRTLLKN